MITQTQEFQDFFKEIKNIYNQIKENETNKQKEEIIKDIIIFDVSAFLFYWINTYNIIEEEIKRWKIPVFVYDEFWIIKSIETIWNLDKEKYEKTIQLIKNLVNNFSVFSFDKIKESLNYDHSLELNRIFNHFKDELLQKWDNFTFANRIVNIKDYIKWLESNKYDIFEKITFTMTWNILVSLTKGNFIQAIQESIVYDEDEISKLLKEYNELITKKSLQDTLNDEYITTNIIASVIITVIDKLVDLINQDERLKLFNPLLQDIINNNIQKWVQDIFLEKIKSFLIRQNSYFMWQDLLDRSIPEIQSYFKENSERFISFLEKDINLNKIVNLLSNILFLIHKKTFFQWILIFKNKIESSFYDYELDYVKILVTYLYVILYNKQVINSTLTMWDELIFNNFVKNFIQIRNDI